MAGIIDPTQPNNTLYPQLPQLPQLPSLSNPYSTLAQQAEPPNGGIVPGGNPAGNIGTAGMAGYMGQQQAEHEALLRKAAVMADIQRQIEQQKASEFQAGAPGRMANIQYSNALAQGNLANAPTDMATSTALKQAGLTKAQLEKLQAEHAKLGEYANMVANGLDPDLVKQQMDKDGVKIGVHKASEVDNTTFVNVMNHIYDSQIFTPQQVGKERITQLGNVGRAIAAANTGHGRAEAADRAGYWKAFIQSHPELNIKDPLAFQYQQLRAELGDQAANEWYQKAYMSMHQHNNPNAPQQLDVSPDMSSVAPRPMAPPQPVPLPTAPAGGPAAGLGNPTSHAAGIVNQPPPLPDYAMPPPIQGGPNALRGNAPGPQIAPPTMPGQPPAGGTPGASQGIQLDLRANKATINGKVLDIILRHRNKDGQVDMVKLSNGQIVPVNGQ